MSASSIGPLEALADGLIDYGLEAFVFVPSSHCAPVIKRLQDRGVKSVLANREEEAVGIAGGMRLCGTRAVIVMQDNGFGNALTALATFAVAYHVGLPIYANTRGGLGEYNSMIHSFTGAVPRLLEAIGVGVERLGPETPIELWQLNARLSAELSNMQRRPIVTLFDSMHPKWVIEVKRIEALRVIDEVFRELPLVITCGATARELASLAKRDNHLYLLDSMGLTSAVGLGVALGRGGPVGVVDGDGSLLMGFSIVPTLAVHAPQNLTVILLDNGQHASAAGMDSQAAEIDLSAVLEGFPFTTTRVEEGLALEAALRAATSSNHFELIVVKIERGNEAGTPFLLEDPALISRRFSDWLAARAF